MGGRYRYSTDDLPSLGAVRWEPRTRNDQLFSVFAQDRIDLAADRFRITVGTKLEHNDYTGFEFQPNARIAWTPGDHTLWGSVSRAVRAPARFERTFEINVSVVPTPPLLGLVFIEGNPAFVSEEVIDYELGYRVQPYEKLSLDVTSFYNDYDHLTSIEPVGLPAFVPVPFPHLEIRQQLGNLLRGSAYGAEIAANVMPIEQWRLALSYSYLRLQFEPIEGSLDNGSASPQGSSPQNQFRLQSYLELSRGLELDATLSYVDELPKQLTPSYTRLDLRFGWRFTERVALSVVGQNLPDEYHLEYGNIGTPASPSLVQRSVFLQIRWEN